MNSLELKHIFHRNAADSNPHRKKALVCPLEWGLGHAARCIPVVKKLESEGFEVTIGSSKKYEVYLSNYFSSVSFIRFPSFTVNYSEKFLFLSLLFQLPVFFSKIIREHFSLARLLKSGHYWLVISDNRYGLWNRKVTSILITHQLFISLPGLLKVFEKPVHFFTKRMIEMYNECWIPDHQNIDLSLAGYLSHGKILPKNCRYIGPLTRFSFVEARNENIPKSGQILVILSGPEKQRTVFEDIIRSQVQMSHGKVIIIRGIPEHKMNTIQDRNITLFSHIDDPGFLKLVGDSEFIICRAGYSIIMDLSALKRTALLVPTPGQTEQEYLAEYLNRKGKFPFLKQKDFKLDKAISVISNFKNKEISH